MQLMAAAGRMLLKGMGRNRTSDEGEGDEADHPLREVRGDDQPEARLQHPLEPGHDGHHLGDEGAEHFARDPPLADVSGSHSDCRPIITCQVRMTSGRPRMAEVPGGVGMMLGTAKMNISAPKARSPSESTSVPMVVSSWCRWT